MGTGTPALQQQDSQLWRFNLNGLVDSGFGVNGRKSTLFDEAYGARVQISEQATDVVVDPDGKINVLGTITGRIYDGSGQPVLTSWTATVGRFTSSGGLDTTYGRGGYAIVPFGVPTRNYNDNVSRSIARLSDGRLLVLGAFSEYSAGVFVSQSIGVARLSNGPSDAGLLTVESSSGLVHEQGGVVHFRVLRLGGSTGQVSVNYATAGGSAVSGVDFVPASGTVTWADGDFTTKVVPVTLLSDPPESTRESFSLSISSPTNGAGLATSTVTVNLEADNVTPSSYITIDKPVVVSESAGSVTVTVRRQGLGTNSASLNYFTLSDTALLNVDFLQTRGMLQWSGNDTTPRTITVPLLDDNQYSGSRRFYVVMIAPGGGLVLYDQLASVTIQDDDPAPQISIASTATVSESLASVVLNVTRSGPASQITTAVFSTANGTATAASDFVGTSGTLTWSPGDPSTKTISIPLIGDALFENDETFTVLLSNPVGGIIAGSGTSTVTITNDDAAPQLSIVGATVSESQSSITLNVTRQGEAASTISVNYGTVDGTATSGMDYGATSSTLTWAPGDASTKSISIPLIGDSVVEGNETFSVVLSNPTGGAVLSTSSATVTITDDDATAASGGGGGKGGGSTQDWMLYLLVGLTMLRVGTPLLARRR